MSAQVLPFIPRHIRPGTQDFIVYAGRVSTLVHCDDEDQVIAFLNACLDRGLMSREEAQMVLDAHGIKVEWDDEPEPQGAA